MTKKITITSKRILSIFTAIGAGLISPQIMAAAPVEFTYQDWQVICDNTRTCRLAGYQTEDNNNLPVSVLLIRRAGANAGVIGKVKLGVEIGGSLGLSLTSTKSLQPTLTKASVSI